MKLPRSILLPLFLLSACEAPTVPAWTERGRRPPTTDTSPPASSDREAEGPTAPPAATPALPRRAGVVFVHGTGDAGDTKDLVCSGAGDAYKCVVEGPVRDYWTQANVDSVRQRADGSMRPFAVIGCPLGSNAPWSNPSPAKRTAGSPSGAEPGTADCVAAQARRFLDGPDGKQGTDDDISDVAIVTHSGGSNVVRYLLTQRTKSADFARVHAAAKRVVAIAPPTRGTYLANYMFRKGSLGNTLNGVIAMLGGSGFYDDDGVAFIQTTEMDASNRDPARFAAVSADVAGVPMYVASGAAATVSIFESVSRCAGNLEADALAVLHTTFLSASDPATYRNACSDGFITCTSAMATASGGARVVFGRTDDGTVVGKAKFRNHNQSRRSCDGVDLDVRAAVDGAGMPRLDGGAAGGAAGSFAADVIRPRALTPGVEHLGAEPTLTSEVPAPSAEPTPRRVTSRVSRVAAGPGRSIRVAVVDREAHVVVSSERGAERVSAESGEIRIDGGRTGAEVEIVEAARPVEISAEVSTPTAFVGERAAVTVAVSDDGRPLAPRALRGAARSPSGRTVALAAERGPRDTWIMHTSLGPDAEPGVWHATFDAEGADVEGRPYQRTVEVAFVVAVPVARVEAIGASRAGRAIVVRAVTSAASRAYLGLRAVLECAGGRRREAQVSFVAEPGGREVELRFESPCGAAEGFSVGDAALVDHDAAATLTYLPSVATTNLR